MAPTEPAAVQDPEITTVPNETTEVAPAPDEKKAETEEAEKAVTDQPSPQQALEQESIKQKESSVKIATKPTVMWNQLIIATQVVRTVFLLL